MESWQTKSIEGTICYPKNETEGIGQGISQSPYSNLTQLLTAFGACRPFYIWIETRGGSRIFCKFGGRSRAEGSRPPNHPLWIRAWKLMSKCMLDEINVYYDLMNSFYNGFCTQACKFALPRKLFKKT
jgi:hypothetical protein